MSITLAAWQWIATDLLSITLAAWQWIPYFAVLELPMHADTPFQVLHNGYIVHIVYIAVGVVLSENLSENISKVVGDSFSCGKGNVL